MKPSSAPYSLEQTQIDPRAGQEATEASEPAPPPSQASGQRLPADDLDTLCRQLSRELGRLEESSGQLQEADAGLYRIYLDHAAVLVIRQVASGDLEAPRRLLSHAVTFQRFANVHAVRDLPPVAVAALGVAQFLSWLDLADRALMTIRRGSQLGRRDCSRLERFILRALASDDPAVRGRLLPKSAVHRLLALPDPPTPVRVGQVLEELYNVGLLLREHGKAQGSSMAALYALSPSGRQLQAELEAGRPRVVSFELDREKLRPRLERALAATKLDTEPPSGGAIVVFYSYRDGVGRAQLLAHYARSVASRYPAVPLLVVDLDLKAPALEAYLLPQRPETCRGLRGLLLDYFLVEPERRGEWLCEQLEPGVGVGKYLMEVATEGGGKLWFLPSGLAPGDSPPPAQERSEVFRLWREEVERVSRTKEGDVVLPSDSFFSRLRNAFKHNYQLTFCDSRSGLGVDAFVATVLLADRLLACVRTCERQVEGYLVVLGNLLTHRALARTPLAKTALTALVGGNEQPREERLKNWLHHTLLHGISPGVEPERLPSVARVNLSWLWSGLLEEQGDLTPPMEEVSFLAGSLELMDDFSLRLSQGGNARRREGWVDRQAPRWLEIKRATQAVVTIWSRLSSVKPDAPEISSSRTEETQRYSILAPMLWNAPPRARPYYEIALGGLEAQPDQAARVSAFRDDEKKAREAISSSKANLLGSQCEAPIAQDVEDEVAAVGELELCGV